MQNVQNKIDNVQIKMESKIEILDKKMNDNIESLR